MRFDSLSAKRRLRINVKFSNHCFSHKKQENTDYPKEKELLDHGGRSRIFCPIRYQLSLALPQIVRSLNNPKCKVYETASRRNFNYSIEVDDPKGPYHLFFEVSKARGELAKMQDITLFVESAYHEDPEQTPPILIGRIGFQVLCSNIYLGKKVSTRR